MVLSYLFIDDCGDDDHDDGRGNNDSYDER